MKKLTLLTFLCAFLTVPLLYGQTFSSGIDDSRNNNSLTSENVNVNTVQHGVAGSRTATNNENYNYSAVTVITNNFGQTSSGSDLACANSSTIVENTIWSEYDLVGNFGIVADFVVTDVEFGIGAVGGGSTPITINIYSNNGVFPGGVWTLQGTAGYNVTAADGNTIVSVPLSATIPLGENLLFEIFNADQTPNNNQYRYMTNGDGALAESWIFAPGCGIGGPMTMTGIGFGGLNFIMNVLNVPPPPPTSSTEFCSTETPLPIDPPGVFSTPAAVSDTGSAADTGLIGPGLGEYNIASVDLNMMHTWAGDLTFTLQSPSGTTLLLSDGNGGNGLDPAADLVFTDASANDVTAWGGGAPMADYMPEGGDFASTFDGEDINGDWYVIVEDFVGGDSGTLNSYCITFERTVGDAPEIFCPADFAADNDEGVCGAVVNFAPPIAIDAEDGVLDPANVVQTGGITTGGFFPVGDNLVTFTATDSHLNETSCSFTITILDAEDTVAVCQDVTVVLDAMGNGSIVASDLDGGSTDNCAVDSMSASQTSFDCSDVGDVTVTLTVFDAAGNSSTCDATVTVVDDMAPVIACIGEPAITRLTHNTDDIITGANTVACSPTADNKFGRHFVLADFGVTDEFTISSGKFGVTSADVAFDATVNIWDVSAGFPAGYPGTSTLLGSQVVNVPFGSDGLIIDYNFATPVVVPVGTAAILVEVTNLDGVVSFFIGGTVGETDDSWLASDACGLTSYGTTSSIGFPDAHYYITVTGTTDVVGPPYEVALDADGLASVPAGLLISGVDEACGYTVSSVGGGSGSSTTLSTPLIGGNGNFGNMFDVTATNAVTVSSFDVHGDVGVTFDVNVWAKTGTHVGSEDTMADWTLLGTAVGIVSNGDGATTPLGLDLGYAIPAGETHAFFVSPIGGGFNYHNGTSVGTSLASDANIEIFEGSAKADDFTGTTFAPRVFEGNLIYSAGGGSGANFDFDCSNLGENIVEVFVTDNAGNESSCFATVVVYDDIAPVLVCQDTTIELGEDGTATIDPMDLLLEATDNCGIDILIADLEEVSCADIGAPIEITVFATDASGNVSACTQEITVVDAMAPVISCPADDSIELDLNGTHTLGDYIADGSATATDNCTDPVTIFTQDPVAGTVLGFGVHTITFTAEDEYGNVATCSFELNLTEYLSNNDNELGNAVSMYPNPARNLVTITNSSNISLDNAMIYDINGKRIAQINLQDMQSEKVIDVSEFATGVYMVQITGEKASVIKRLIKK